MTSETKYIYRVIPKEDLKYLPKHAVATGGVSGRKGHVCVRFNARWYRRRSNKLYKALFRRET